MASSFLNIEGFPAGLRNNNPGNVRPLGRGKLWLGQIAVNRNFAVFKNIGYGIRAMAKNAITQVLRYKNNTVVKYINAYAPPSENNTKKYIVDVAKSLGIKPTDKILLTYPTLKKLIKIHIVKEIGAHGALITDADIDDGILKLRES